MALHTPVWDDDLKFAKLRNDDEWTQSRVVKIATDVTSEALQRAHERANNVQYLHVSWLLGGRMTEVFSLLENASMPNLRALCIETPLSERRAVDVANALRNKPQLEQLRLCCQGKSDEATIGLFDALSSVPLLRALNLESARAPHGISFRRGLHCGFGECTAKQTADRTTSTAFTGRARRGEGRTVGCIEFDAAQSAHVGVQQEAISAVD